MYLQARKCHVPIQLKTDEWGSEKAYSAHLQQATGARVECMACRTCCMNLKLVERLMIALAAKSALSAMTRTADSQLGINWTCQC
jgi:hypothetical protein